MVAKEYKMVVGNSFGIPWIFVLLDPERQGWKKKIGFLKSSIRNGRPIEEIHVLFEREK